MESWMVSLGIAMAVALISYVVTRQSVAHHAVKIHDLEVTNALLKTFKDESAPLLAHLSRAEDSLKSDMDTHAKDIVFVKEKVNNAATMKEVRDDFVSKELFLAMKEHFNSKFEHLDQTIEKGLHEIAKKIEAKL